MKYPLRFIVSYVQHVTQHFKSRTVQKAPLQFMHTKRKKWCRVPQLYQLSSEKSSIHYTSLSAVFNPLYTAVRIKNCLKSTSAIKIATIKIRTVSIMKRNHHMLLPNQHFSLSAKMNGTQRRTLQKDALYVLRYVKRHLLGHSDVEQ